MLFYSIMKSHYHRITIKAHKTFVDFLLIAAVDVNVVVMLFCLSLSDEKLFHYKLSLLNINCFY